MVFPCTGGAAPPALEPSRGQLHYLADNRWFLSRRKEPKPWPRQDCFLGTWVGSAVRPPFRGTRLKREHNGASEEVPTLRVPREGLISRQRPVGLLPPERAVGTLKELEASGEGSRGRGALGSHQLTVLSPASLSSDSRAI